MPTTADIASLLQQPMQAEHRDRPALSIENDTTWTYEELFSQSNRYANGLLRLGVKPGDRVAMLLHNSLEYWALYLAITRIQAIAVRVNFRLASRELAYVLADSGATIIVMHDALVQNIEEVRNQLDVRHYIVVMDEPASASWLHSTHGSSEFADTSEPTCPLPMPDQTAMLMYTSGTTGKPKAAVWTHKGTMWFAAMQAMQWGFNSETVAMTTGPLYHVGSFEDLQLPTLTLRGQAVMFRSGNFSAERMVDVLEHRRVTDCLIYPFMISEMLRLPDLAGRDLSSLQRIITGGSEIGLWAIDRLRALLPQTELVPVYGLTEGGGIATAVTHRTELKTRPKSVGQPMPLTSIQIVDENGKVVPAGGVGEIWIKSPSVSPEYWENEAASRETFVDGWCRSGDLGSIDEAGQLTITGRAKDMIKSGGENIYPAEIELVLQTLEGVLDAAVIALPDSKFEESVCAVVVKDAQVEVSAQDVIEHCRQHLASYKKPKHVVFVAELPRTPSGKVTKFTLRDQFLHLAT